MGNRKSKNSNGGKSNMETRGIEPPTFWMPFKRSPNWATSPLGIRFLPISLKSIINVGAVSDEWIDWRFAKKLKIQNDIIKGYEKVLRLNEQELKNADEIIRMYEGIVQYSGKELKDVREAFDATNSVTNLSREELMGALSRIQELENANKKLREESLKFQSG